MKHTCEKNPYEKNPYEKLVIYNFDGVPVDNPALEKDERFLGTWVEEDTSFVFFSARADLLVEEIEDKNPDISLVETYEMTCEQWHGEKVEPYFVEDLLISPPWEAGGKKSAAHEILLDPGVVFGTGRHQTTEDCLTLIHRLCSRGEIKSVLDIGTGTGLLSLGAAALGCERVLACDFNLLAVKTCKKNIRLNGFDQNILAFQARGEEAICLPCDLLVANIHYDVMQHLILHPAFLEKEYFILSGLLNSETTKIMAVLATKKVHIIERRCPDGIWNTLLGRSL
jgi:ribosomal protein L11 methyltransferase